MRISGKEATRARRFYAVLAAAMLGGHAIDFVGVNAVKMLFRSAVINGTLAPPLILLVVLLTSNKRVMGARVVRPPCALSHGSPSYS